MTLWKRRAQRWLEVAGGAGSALFAPIAGAAFLVRAPLARPRLRDGMPWAVLWFGALLPIVILEVGLGHLGAAATWLGQAALGTAVGWIARGRLGAVRGGLVVGIATLALLLVVGQSSGSLLWNTGPNDNAILSLARLAITGQEHIRHAVARTWTLPAGQQGVSFQAKLRTLASGHAWAWQVNGRVDVAAAPGGEDAAQLSFGRGGDPYAQRTFDLGAPAGGTAFRVTLEARADTPLKASGCRGVWLQVWGQGGGSTCDALALGPTWKRFTLAWTAPKGASSHVIRVVLNDFDGHTIDVRAVRLYRRAGGTWTELTPLAPAGDRISLHWTGAFGSRDRTFQVRPGPAWQTFQGALGANGAPPASSAAGTDPPGSDRVRVTVIPAPAATLAIRDASVTTTVVAGRPRLSSMRQSLWFGQPNLAGHSIAAAGLAALALTGSLGAMLLIALLTAVAVFLTGSRTAFLVLVVGAALLVAVRHARRARWVLPAAITVTILSAAVVGLTLLPEHPGGRWLTFNEGQLTPRSAIWAAGLDAWVAHPFTGLSGAGTSFETYWHRSPRNHTGEAIRHAHDFWIELAAMYGLPGVWAAAGLGLGLLWLGWRRGSTAGALFVAAIVTLNVLDDTLLYAGVLVPLLLGLNALSRNGTRSAAQPIP